MKKFLFSILGAFMVSTMASAQYVNVKMDDGTYASYKTSSKTEVDFGKKKGAELTPAGYYSKAEVDSMLTEIKDVLLGDMTVEDAKEFFVRNSYYSATEMLREIAVWHEEHQRYLEDINELLTGDREGWYRLVTYMADFPYGVLEYLKSGVRSKAKTASIPANAEAVSLDETLEENKFLKKKIEELEKRLEALEAK